MDERRLHIDEFFRRQMEDQAEMPPPPVWEALEKRLDDRGRKRAFPLWWFWGLAGLLLLSGSLLVARYLAPEAPVTAAVAGGAATQPATTVAHTADNVAPVIVNATHQGAPAEKATRTQQNATNRPSNVREGTAAQKLHTTPSPATNHDKTSISPDNTANNADTRVESTVKVNTPLNNPPVGNTPAGSTVPTPGDNRAATAGPAYSTGIAAVAVKAGKVPEVKKGAEKNNDSKKQDAASGETFVNNVPVSELLASLNTPPKAYSVSNVDDKASQQPSGLPADVFPEASGSSVSQVETGVSYADTSKRKVRALGDTAQSILDQVVSAPPTPDAREKRPLAPLQFGMRIGYSRGIDNAWRGDKVIFSPYLEYPLGSGFSLMIQPGIGVGKARTGVLNNSSRSYYEVKSSSFDSTSRLVRGVVDSSILTPNPPDTVFRTYKYGQVYDSVHVAYRVLQKQLWDIELPVMVKYKVSKSFSVILGVSGTYSSALFAAESVQRYSGLNKSYSENIDPATFYVTAHGQLTPAAPPRKAYEDLFTHSTEPFGNYQARPATAKVSNFFRYGFMIGASANLTPRWMVDVMLHKSGVDTKAVPDKQLQRIYTQPYLRVSVGYKLSK